MEDCAGAPILRHTSMQWTLKEERPAEANTLVYGRWRVMSGGGCSTEPRKAQPRVLTGKRESRIMTSICWKGTTALQKVRRQVKQNCSLKLELKRLLYRHGQKGTSLVACQESLRTLL